MRTASEIVSEHTALTREASQAADCTKTGVPGSMKSKRDMPLAFPSSARAGITVISLSRLSESWVSTLNVRMESISSSKKSTR